MAYQQLLLLQAKILYTTNTADNSLLSKDAFTNTFSRLRIRNTPLTYHTHTPKCRITESSSTNYLPRNKMKIIQENTLQQLKMSSWQYFETKTIKITKWQYDVKIYGAILYKINGIALALPMPLVGWLGLVCGFYG